MKNSSVCTFLHSSTHRGSTRYLKRGLRRRFQENNRLVAFRVLEWQNGDIMIFKFNFEKIDFSRWFKKENSPNHKANIKSASIGNDVVVGDQYNFLAKEYPVSDLEKKILKVLYNFHKNNSGASAKIKIVDVYKQLEIENGQWVGVLNDSHYLSVDGEYFSLTTDGLRYMDSMSDVERNEILLPVEKREEEKMVGKILGNISDRETTFE
jgi:hypothetical protein